MAIKIFNNQKITIRKFKSNDLVKARQFQQFINDLIEEGAPLKANKIFSLKQEKDWICKQLMKIREKKTLILVAESGGKILGNAGIDMDWGRRNHVGKFCIAVDKNFRSFGLGGYLAREIIEVAKKELKLKILRLTVYPTNKKAIAFYQRLGFREVAVIPRQIQHQSKLIPEIVMLLDLPK